MATSAICSRECRRAYGLHKMYSTSPPLLQSTGHEHLYAAPRQGSRKRSQTGGPIDGRSAGLPDRIRKGPVRVQAFIPTDRLHRIRPINQWSLCEGPGLAERYCSVETSGSFWMYRNTALTGGATQQPLLLKIVCIIPAWCSLNIFVCTLKYLHL